MKDIACGQQNVGAQQYTPMTVILKSLAGRSWSSQRSKGNNCQDWTGNAATLKVCTIDAVHFARIQNDGTLDHGQRHFLLSNGSLHTQIISRNSVHD